MQDFIKAINGKAQAELKSDVYIDIELSDVIAL